jgi:hypothetical protein
MRSSKLRLAPIIGLSLLTVMLLPGVAAAASNLAIYVPAINGNCLYFRAPANQTLTLTWKDSAGALKESASIPTGVSGDPNYCSTSNVIEVGDHLKVTLGSNSHKLTIPNITARVNRVTDVIKGTGPVGAHLGIDCGGGPFGAFEPCQWHKNVTVNSAGNWSVQIPFDVYGGWTMHASWFNSYGDLVSRNVTVPYFQVFIGQARFSGIARPGISAMVDLQDASMVDKGSASADSDPITGWFTGQLRDDANHVVPVAVGDRVSSDIAPDASFVVPEIDARATAADDHVWGQCELTPAYNLGVFVELYRNGHLRGAAWEGFTDGTFDFDFQHTFPDPVNVMAGDKLFVKCIQGEGDFAVKVIFAQ